MKYRQLVSEDEKINKTDTLMIEVALNTEFNFKGNGICIA